MYIRPTPEPKEFEEKMVQINRISKKTKGGNKMRFAALMVIGNKKGQVGVGLGKAADVSTAMKKGVNAASKQLFTVPMHGTTIPHEVRVKFGASRILLKPAPAGSGVIAGGSIRAVVEAAGIRDVVGKILGTNNKIGNVYATVNALKMLKVRS
ncbi:MAG: 30S ribosomal protein S5 [Patescibacteria group bacterium]